MTRHSFLVHITDRDTRTPGQVTDALGEALRRGYVGSAFIPEWSVLPARGTPTRLVFLAKVSYPEPAVHPRDLGRRHHARFLLLVPTAEEAMHGAFSWVNERTTSPNVSVSVEPYDLSDPASFIVLHEEVK